MTRKEAMRFLPQKPTESRVNPATLTTLVIGEPKFGKTRFFASNPNAVLLAFEPGYKFVKCKKIVIDKWDHKGHYPIKIDSDGDPHMTAMQALEALEVTSVYDMGIIDTVDMMTKMASDWFCAKANKEHPSDMGDYGKGWDKAQNNPIRQFLLRLQKTGRGMGLITHTKVEVARFTTGEKARKQSTLPKGVMKFCHGFADIILHGELGKQRAGRRLRDRIFVTEADEDVEAGNRTGALLPQRYIIDPENQWAQFVRFFKHPKYAEEAAAEYKKTYKQ